MTFDVIKALDDMQDRFYKQFGDLHKPEFSQHEKHLTWMQSFYYPDSSNTEKDRNKAFVLGYRIGRAENKKSYDQGYRQALEDASWAVRELK